MHRRHHAPEVFLVREPASVADYSENSWHKNPFINTDFANVSLGLENRIVALAT